MRPLKFKALWIFLGWSYVALIIYLSLIYNPPRIMEFEQSDKLKHMLAYGGMMFYFSQLIENQTLRLRHALIFVLMGALIEVLQGIGGVRSMEFLDAVANATGVGLGYVLGPKLRLYKWVLQS